jgi:hypothetical protein
LAGLAVVFVGVVDVAPHVFGHDHDSGAVQVRHQRARLFDLDDERVVVDRLDRGEVVDQFTVAAVEDRVLDHQVEGELGVVRGDRLTV